MSYGCKSRPADDGLSPTTLEIRLGVIPCSSYMYEMMRFPSGDVLVGFGARFGAATGMAPGTKSEEERAEGYK